MNRLKIDLMTKLQKISVFSMIVIIVIGATAAAAILLSQQKATTEQRSDSAVLPASPAEKKADTAEQAAINGDVEEGVKTLESALKATSDASERYIYYTNIATILFNAGEYDKALAPAKSAYDIKKSSDAAAFVAQIAQEKGNNAEAIDYYRKAVAVIDPQDPFSDEDRKYYEGMIAEIEKGQ